MFAICIPMFFFVYVFKLNAKFDADLLFNLLSHFECKNYTVHMLTQQHLLPPLTITVKSTMFTPMHSSPLSLFVRLHHCCVNCSCYINNDWTFSRHISYLLLDPLQIKAAKLVHREMLTVI